MLDEGARNRIPIFPPNVMNHAQRFERPPIPPDYFPDARSLPTARSNFARAVA